MGRPSKADAARRKRLLELAAKPGKLGDIARAAGVSRSTLARWRRLGDEGDPRYAKWAAAFEAARSETATRLLARIEEIGMDADGKNWIPIAWLLERSYGYTQQGAYDDPDSDTSDRTGEARAGRLAEVLADVQPTAAHAVPED